MSYRTRYYVNWVHDCSWSMILHKYSNWKDLVYYHGPMWKNSTRWSMILHEFFPHSCRIVDSKGPLWYIRFRCHDSTWVLGPLQYTSFWKVMSFLGPWKFMRYPSTPRVESWTHFLKQFWIGNCGSMKVHEVPFYTSCRIMDPLLETVLDR